MDLQKIAARVAATTIPKWVQTGEQIDEIAAQYEASVQEMQAIEARAQAAIDKLVALKQGAEYGLELSIDRVLKKIKRPGWIGMASLKEDLAFLKKTAQELKTAVR